MNEQHDQWLKAAIEIFSSGNPTSTAERMAYWRGTNELPSDDFPTASGVSTGDGPGCVVVLEYARNILRASSTNTAETKERKEVLLDQIKKLTGLFGKDSGLQLAKALGSMAAAAVYYRQKDYEKSSSHIGKAAKIYDKWWRISPTRVGQPQKIDGDTYSTDLYSGDAAAEAMEIAEQSGVFGEKGVAQSTWLTIYFTLRYLLDQPDAFEADPRLPLKMLLADTDNDLGQVVQVRIQRANLNWNDVRSGGVFLDSRSWGITYPTVKAYPIKPNPDANKPDSENADTSAQQTPSETQEPDRALRGSLILAWRCCHSSLPHNDRQSTILRISIDMPVNYQTLEGASAGGLFAVGMYAAAQREPVWLDTTCTTTCSLAPNPNATDEDLARIGDINQPLYLDDVVLKSVGSVPTKLDEARLRKHGLDTFLLHPNNAAQWQLKRGQSNYPKIVPVQTLADLWKGFLVQNEEERELDQAANYTHGAWDRAIEAIRTGNPNNAESYHRLDCYVPQDVYVEQTQRIAAKDSKRGTDRSAIGSDSPEDKLVTAPVPNASDDENLLHLLALSIRGTRWPDQPKWVKPQRHLVIYDNAGAGKTVCSLRLRRLLTNPIHRKRIFGHDYPPLVVHLDGRWPREHETKGRLLSLRELLKVELARQTNHDPKKDDDLIDRAVTQALCHNRVVIIADGLDQFWKKERNHLAVEFNRSHAQGHCRWIVTSRAHAIEEARSSGLFYDDHWLRVRLDPFSERQQDRYFDSKDAYGKVIGPKWEVMVDRDEMNELLKLPVVLAMLRLLLETAEDSMAPLPVFESLSQLSLITSRKMLQIALEKNLPKIERELSTEQWRAFENLGNEFQPKESAQLNLLEHVLSLFAFQFMLTLNYNGRVYGVDSVAELIAWCEKRFLYDVNYQDMSGLTRSEQLKRDAQILAKLHQFEIAVKVLRTIELSHRSITEAFGQAVLALRSRKVMECLAARYLTRYATQHDVFGEFPDTCWDFNSLSTNDVPNLAAIDFVTEGEWKQTWELAIEMPHQPLIDELIYRDAIIDHATTCRSLSVLFELPKPYSGRFLRPTELMYRVWHMFEIDHDILRDRRFRINGKMLTGAKLQEKYGLDRLLEHGQRLLLGEWSAAMGRKNSDVISQRNEVLKRFRSTSRPLVEHYERTQAMDFIQLADPQNSRDSFDTGEINLGPSRSSKYQLIPYRLHQYCVKNWEYELFDPLHENLRQFKWCSDIDAHPVVMVSWVDAWCYCRWLMGFKIQVGNRIQKYATRLPTDAQWVYGCECGRASLQDCNLKSGECNFDGNFPWPKGTKEKSKAIFLKRTIRVDGKDDELTVKPNPWGLFQMLGNVSEWNQSKLRGWFYDGLGRIIRGGCWNDMGECVRSRYRSGERFDIRRNYIGFRLALVLVGEGKFRKGRLKKRTVKL